MDENKQSEAEPQKCLGCGALVALDSPKVRGFLAAQITTPNPREKS